MIATPGDVTKEREIIREVIHDWNDINASNSKIILSPVGWDTHSSPELGNRPQELINSRLLKDCDLLVGVFWTRIGTPTGKARSGTVEEIEEHVAAGKPAMIYFSSQPVVPESIDLEQYAEVKSFKAKCKELGLIETFDDDSQFKEKFSKHLPVSLNNSPYLQELMSASSNQLTIQTEIRNQDKEVIDLSVESMILLKAAASKDNGTILKIASNRGRVIQAGGETFGGKDNREAAKWESALEELVNNDLVVARGYKDQVFELTNLGWIVSDDL